MSAADAGTWRDNRRCRARTSTTLPESLPPVLVSIWLFDFLEDPSNIRDAEGYELHDLVNTLGRLRRVCREFRSVVDATFAQWKVGLGVEDGFFIDSPCATLFDLRACAWRACFVCAKSVDGRVRTGSHRGIVRHVDESRDVRDADVLCCPRCREQFFSTRDHRVAGAFPGASQYLCFFYNEGLPLTPLERFSGVLDSMILKRNAVFRAYAEKVRQGAARSAIEWRLVSHAKKKDLAKTVQQAFGIRSKLYEKTQNFSYDVHMGVRPDGTVLERFLKKVAAMGVLGRGLLGLCAETGTYGHTWQADMMADAFYGESLQFDRIQWRHRLQWMSELGRRVVYCEIRNVRFVSARRRGVETLYTRCFDTTAVELNLESIPRRATRSVQHAGIDVVVDGDFLHEHFAETDVAGALFREANVDAQILARERGRLWRAETSNYNQAVRKNAALHEARLLCALQDTLRRQVDGLMRLSSFSAAFNHSIDRDFSLLLRLANPFAQDLPKRRYVRGMPAFFKETRAKKGFLICA